MGRGGGLSTVVGEEEVAGGSQSRSILAQWELRCGLGEGHGGRGWGRSASRD